MLFAPWLVVLLAGAAGIVEMSIGLHAARIKKPFLLPAHHLYWTRAALLAAIIFGLPRLTFLAPAINSNAFDSVLLLPIGLAAGCFWMLGRGYAAPGLARDAMHDVRSAPFVLHTLKGALLTVAAVAGFLVLIVGGR